MQPLVAQKKHRLWLLDFGRRPCLVWAVFHYLWRVNQRRKSKEKRQNKLTVKQLDCKFSCLKSSCSLEKNLIMQKTWILITFGSFSGKSQNKLKEWFKKLQPTKQNLAGMSSSFIEALATSQWKGSVLHLRLCLVPNRQGCLVPKEVTPLLIASGIYFIDL